MSENETLLHYILPEVFFFSLSIGRHCINSIGWVKVDAYLGSSTNLPYHRTPSAPPTSSLYDGWPSPSPPSTDQCHTLPSTGIAINHSMAHFCYRRPPTRWRLNGVWKSFVRRPAPKAPEMYRMKNGLPSVDLSIEYANLGFHPNNVQKTVLVGN